MKTVAICGLGLIGGSFGLALRQAGFEGEIVGLCGSPYAEQALQMGAISRVARDLHEVAECADWIYLSDTVDGILATIRVLGPIAKAGTLITDVGSTKTAIVSEATQHLRGAEFMGGHPITGKEKRGIENADADLFRNRPYVLTSRSESANTKEFVFWLNNIGATVIYSTPAEHDRILGYTSHLPQLLSTALAVTLARQNERAFSEIFGPGLTDMTRLALSSGDLWIGILKTNKEVVKNALLALEQTLEELAKCLDADQLDSLFTRANEFAEKLRTNPKA